MRIPLRSPISTTFAPAVRPCPDATVGQMQIWFVPSASEADRTAILAKMHKRLRCPRRLHCTRTAWEHRGAAVLAAEDQATSSPRLAWTVRVYYLSMANELVYFEAGGLTRSQANELARSGVVAQKWAAHSEAPAAREGARRVVLPSQRTECVQVLVDGDWRELVSDEAQEAA